MALSPAQNHEVELPIPIIDQVPCVSGKDDMHYMITCAKGSRELCTLATVKGVKGVPRRSLSKSLEMKMYVHLEKKNLKSELKSQ